MKNILIVFNRLLADVSNHHKVRICAPHDIDTLWVLKVGPALDKLVLNYLETGTVVPPFPEWLKPLWDLFSVTDDATVLRSIRQVLKFGYKTEFEPTDEQIKEAQASFINVDCSIPDYEAYLKEAPKEGFFRSARQLVSRVIANPAFYDITPSHGPGAVYPSYPHWQRSDFRNTSESIDKLYPFYSYFRPLNSDLEFLDCSGSFPVTPCDVNRAKLVAVPKDSRGPRLICVHSRESIWIQQGLRKRLEDLISSSRLTSRNIKFHDQSLNANKALLGSADRSYATIDLKDASDCISIGLTQFLLGSDYQFFECCRASSVTLINGESISLKKYAPMGNATVFPLQSLFFWALVRAGITCHTGKACCDIFVFGDDIIVPNEHYEIAIRSLVRAGLRPNPGKCFHRGFFRESCGTDAYKGTDVTPVMVKRLDVRRIANLVSMCSVAKSLRIRGYEETAACIYSLVRKARRGLLHLSNNPDAQGVFEYVDRDFSFMLRNEPSLRWNNSLHKYETAVFQAKSVLHRPRVSYRYNILDSLLRFGGETCWTPLYGDAARKRSTGNPPMSTGSLSYPVPRRVRLARGWTDVIMSYSEELRTGDQLRLETARQRHHIGGVIAPPMVE